MIDDAIAATEPAPKVEMTQAQMTLGTGRPMYVALPADFTDTEALQAVFALLQAMDKIRAQRPASRLVSVNGGRLT